jgi:replication factor C subunit 3/5
MNNVPWVEKYRPKYLNEIVLDEWNEKILKNIIKNQHFPNLLLYGPPGTGKTTSVIRLIEEYQNEYSKINREHVIHLNASDERGIDVIRNQIMNFVSSKNLFKEGLKFVILDEVDYMTKSAQQALKLILQEDFANVRFCLICNYISKIETSLQNHFVKLRFNELPTKKIRHFLKTISKQEELNMANDKIKTIQIMFKSDMRSMINFLQLNNRTDQKISGLLTDSNFAKLLEKLQNKSVETTYKYLKKMAQITKNSEGQIIKLLLNYLVIRRKNVALEKTCELLKFYNAHTQSNYFYTIQYILNELKKSFTY